MLRRCRAFLHTLYDELTMPMQALIRDSGEVQWRETSRPTVQGPDDVIVRVVRAGICRTDLYVASGRMPSADPVVLGHEFAGVVEAVGAGVDRVAPGDPVSAHPFVRCGDCAGCRRQERCVRPRMLGVWQDGAFAEFVRVPAEVVHRLPAELPWELGAYLEPVAASLAVVGPCADRPKTERVLVYGEGRIADLTTRVMVACKLEAPERAGVDDILDEAAYDCIVETVATEASLAELLRALRPGGTLILKSRPAAAVPLDIQEAVRRDITLRAVGYGPYDTAISLLVGGRLDVSDLMGPVHQPADFATVFASLEAGEDQKHFFGFGG